MPETPMFACFLEEDKQTQNFKKLKDEKDFIENHMRSVRHCWPQWKGPRVDPDSIDGFCSVHMPIVYSITHASNQYRYMAPCRIISISADGETLEVEIEYHKGSTCEHYNGERLRLHIGEVWAPTSLINQFHFKR